MKFIIAAAILFFANVLLANECHDKALAAAKKADGQGVAGSSGAVITKDGKVTKGMLDPDGNKIGEMQAEIANGRAAAIKAVTGKDLTPEQATALLNDANAKKLLGDDYKYYLAEKSRIGGAAALKAEEAAKTAAEAAELKRKAEEETRARIEADKKRADAQAREQQRLKDEADARQREKEALDRRQAASQNPYVGANPKYEPTFKRDPSQMDGMSARQNLTNYTSPDVPAPARVLNGMENAISAMQSKISNLKSAIAKSEAEDRVKGIAKDKDGVNTTRLKGYLEQAKAECRSFSSIATTAGLTGSTIQSKISDLISAYCY